MIEGSIPSTPMYSSMVEQWSLKPKVLGSNPSTLILINPSSNGRTLTFHVNNMSSILIG